MEVTEGSRVTWEEMWFVVGFVDQVWMLADGYNAGPRDHSCVPLLHTLNKTNIDDRIMAQVHAVMAEFGGGGPDDVQVGRQAPSMGVEECRQIHPPAMEIGPGDEIHTLIASMDIDGNGTVEFDELTSSLSQLLLGPGRSSVAVDHEQLAEAFRAFDRDGNGYISAAELARSMAQMGHPICYAELNDMMREADTDGDGSISFEEFAAIMAKSAVEFLGLAAL
ncbi:putative calcium-binding protein CML12 [Triticum urartu]|uniref:Putative calcium-binding protein CML12 n=1 Tax=Triticum urartu TaxID=4572 RepID=M7YA45_TRIUA|nr:putative calcium-binding protein CML12 [Triticum urartu]